MRVGEANYILIVVRLFLYLSLFPCLLQLNLLDLGLFATMSTILVKRPVQDRPSPL